MWVSWVYLLKMILPVYHKQGRHIIRMPSKTQKYSNIFNLAFLYANRTRQDNAHG
jgi:hypothetical protein